MENIFELNKPFDFSKLSLAHPSAIQGGAYFTKIEHGLKPLYIQTTKSQTKQGISKSGKKHYCDLMFDKNSEEIVNWFETLEEVCQQLIFEKRDTWFQTPLDKNDIESVFNSTMRIYKSGNFYLLRTNIKNDYTNSPVIKIYNENKKTLTIEDIHAETHIISILEIQGIKFTSRNFQIEIELKQIMTVEDEPFFNNCVIKSHKEVLFTKNNKNEKDIIVDTNMVDQNIDDTNIVDTNIVDTNIDDMNIDDPNIVDMNIDDPNIVECLEEINISTLPIENPEQDVVVKDTLDIKEEVEVPLEIVENDNNPEELKEFDLSLENYLEESFHLKKPNQVYFELYKEARNKAKIAKKNALIAYLEAKNIKKTYMLENLNDSDSDSEIDDEIDDVNESDLNEFDV
ncbi:hypothetical protein N9K75_00095 [bacterium]|nr:hypothetical protein [bacterium]